MGLQNAVADQVDLNDIGQYLLQKAKTANIDQAEVDLTSASGVAVSARLGKLETLEQQHDQTLTLTLYKNQCAASVSSTDWSYAALDQAFEKARSLVGFVQPDEASGLADIAESAFDYPELDLYHPDEQSVEQMKACVFSMDQQACAADSRILHPDSCRYDTSNVSRYYANTHDMTGQYRYSRHLLSCSVVVEDSSGMQSNSDYDINCDAALLQSPLELAQQTVDRACQHLGARKVPTQKSPVLFSPRMAKTLISHFLSAINGHNIYRDSSFLKGRCGDQIFPEFVSLVQYPHKKGSLFSAPFDSEGVKTREYAIIENGRFERFLCDSYAARRLGCAVTGNAGGVFNARFITGDHMACFSDMLHQMGTGLFVTELMGRGANVVNGDYSRGASGFWVERGEIAFPVEGITIAGNLVDMFAGITALGSDIDERSHIQSGSILLDSLTISGT